MKHIVEVRNIHSGFVVERFEFDDAAEALEYAFTMNELMKATPLRYVFMN
jgi:hypothetical protein